jgi:uncharacterized protein YndB with AHSA1/START domain
VTEPERLVYKHGGEKDVEPVNFTVTATFDDLGGGRTKLTMRMVFPSAAARDFVVKTYGAVEGLTQTMERLGEHVAAGGARGFVISRTFDAPRDVVWRAWTRREALMQWFGPQGFTMTTAKLDLRPGGTFHYRLQSPDGHEMWGLFAYREVVPPERIVWVNSFSDESGGVARHAMHTEWPLEMLTTATFVERDGKTTVTVRSEALNATASERATFDANHESMRMGWTGTLDQLAAHLARA